MPFDMTVTHTHMTDYLDKIIADTHRRFPNVQPERRTQLVRAWISNNARAAVARAATARLNEAYA